MPDTAYVFTFSTEVALNDDQLAAVEDGLITTVEAELESLGIDQSFNKGLMEA